MYTNYIILYGIFTIKERVVIKMFILHYAPKYSISLLARTYNKIHFFGTELTWKFEFVTHSEPGIPLYFPSGYRFQTKGLHLVISKNFPK